MKNYLICLSVVLAGHASGQKLNIQNMFDYLRAKNYVKAKEAADAAAVHEDTKDNLKMWKYRGDVYKAISADTSTKVRSLDPEAEEKALEAYVNCLKGDSKNIYKDEVKGPLAEVCNSVNRKAFYYRQGSEFAKALRCYDLLETALPFDFDESIKRYNITSDKITFNKFELHQQSGNFEKAREMADKLIAISYREPRLYTDMVNMSLQKGDTATALDYIQKSKKQFEDNLELIEHEIAIYKKRNKTNVLKDRLIDAIGLTPDNEVLHLMLANLYKATDQNKEAEAEYLKALEIRQDYEPALYNLGVLYYSHGKQWNDKLNELPVKDPKAKDYETKSLENFRKAVDYFERSFEITKENRTKQVIRQLYLRLGETEKANQYK